MPAQPSRDDYPIGEPPLPEDADLGFYESMMVSVRLRGDPTIRRIFKAGDWGLLWSMMEEMWVTPGCGLDGDVETLSNAAGIDCLAWVEKWAALFEPALLRCRNGRVYLRAWIGDVLKSWRCRQKGIAWTVRRQML